MESNLDDKISDKFFILSLFLLIIPSTDKKLISFIYNTNIFITS